MCVRNINSLRHCSHLLKGKESPFNYHSRLISSLWHYQLILHTTYLKQNSNGCARTEAKLLCPECILGNFMNHCILWHKIILINFTQNSLDIFFLSFLDTKSWHISDIYLNNVRSRYILSAKILEFRKSEVKRRMNDYQ